MGDDTGVQRSLKDNSKVRLLLSGKYWVWVLVVLAIVIAGTVYEINHIHTNNQKKNKATGSYKCSPDIMQQAATDFDPNKSQDLEKLVTRIKAIPNYDKDPNCLYVVTTFYVEISDPDNSKSGFDKIVALDPDGKKIKIPGLYEGKTALDTLKTRVDSLQRSKSDDREGVIPPGGLE